MADTVQLRIAAVPTVELNADLVRALSTALDEARDRDLSQAPHPGDLLRLPQAITVRAADRAGPADRGAAGCQRRGGGRAGTGRPRRDATGGQPSPRGSRRAETSLDDLIERLAGAAEAGRSAVEARLQGRSRISFTG